jgi:hypothetical protein
VSSIKEKLIKLMRGGNIELISTHVRLSFPIIERMYRKMIINVPFRSISVVGGAIMNGHHRYLASLLANYNLDRSNGIRSLAKSDVDWSTVILEDVDWDTAEDVEKFNKEDAKYLGITLEELLEKVK